MSATQQPFSTRARPRPTSGRFAGEPNPLLVRELRQSLRLPRLPWTICAIVALVGLGMLSIGSIQSQVRPATLGIHLFSGFISILLLYVALVGPATAAGAIASEREGKTLEPLLLTSLAPRDIARGKFLAAYGTIGLQILAMMPLAAIPLLFGGVTAGELLVSFVFVAALAAVSVAFGLAVASRAQTLRSALAVSILLPAAAAPLGFLASYLAGNAIIRRAHWSIPESPTWWANAYTSVPFGLDYVVWLIVWPLVLLVLPFWLFTALTGANLAGPNDDRSSGLKRWFVGACVAISSAVFLTTFRVEAADSVSVATFGLVLVSFLLLLMAVLNVGEPNTASRLVRARWTRLGTGPIGRMLGPGLVRGAVLQILFGAIALCACYAGGVLASSAAGLRKVIGVATTTTAHATVSQALAIVLVYALMFDIFLVGLGCFLRTKKVEASVATARAWVIAIAVVALIVPWILSTLFGSFGSEKTARLIAAPSPGYAFFAFDKELTRPGDTSDFTIAALGAALAWGAAGLVLLGVAWERGRRSIAAGLRTEAATTRKLDQEDEEDYSDEDEEPAPAPVKPPPPPMPSVASTASLSDATKKDEEPSGGSEAS